MPLPPSDPDRIPKHCRTVNVQAYARSDALWEIEARITDVKTRAVHTGDITREPGEAIHDLTLRLVVDVNFNVLQAGAESISVPYPGHCDDHGEVYAQLEGLNLLRGFKRAVRERLGGIAACTHLTELADVLPSAVIQAFAGEVIDTRGENGEKPFQLDRCHALVSDGEVVRLHYPTWFRQPDANKLSQNRTPVELAASQGEPQSAAIAPPFSS